MNAYERFQSLCEEARGEDKIASDYANRCGELMNDDLREEVAQLFNGVPGIDSGDFLQAYCERHQAKFGEAFDCD